MKGKNKKGIEMEMLVWMIIAIVILGGSVFSVMNYFKKPEQPADNYERIKILLAEELSKIKLDSAVVQNIYYIKQQEEKIKNLENEVKEYKSLLDEKINTGFIEKRVSKMNINFIDNKSGEQKILDCVDICCWWCTYEFDTLPCFIPEKYDDGKYYVFGCFCSFNCAASYNINTNDYKIWERYSLLKKLYNKIHNTNEDISLAPDRETLKKFGGPLTIDEFRKNNNICEKEYRFIMPPMVSIIPLIEETFKDNVKFRKIKSFWSDDNLVLKRNKPLPNTKSNLIDTLGILRRKKIK